MKTEKIIHDFHIISFECGKCHQTIQASYNFCPYCGTELEDETVAIKRKEKNEGAN